MASASSKRHSYYVEIEVYDSGFVAHLSDCGNLISERVCKTFDELTAAVREMLYEPQQRQSVYRKWKEGKR